MVVADDLTSMEKCPNFLRRSEWPKSNCVMPKPFIRSPSSPAKSPHRVRNVERIETWTCTKTQPHQGHSSRSEPTREFTRFGITPERKISEMTSELSVAMRRHLSQASNPGRRDFHYTWNNAPEPSVMKGMGSRSRATAGRLRNNHKKFRARGDIDKPEDPRHPILRLAYQAKRQKTVCKHWFRAR